MGNAAQQQVDWKKAEDAFLNSLKFLRDRDYPILNGEIHIALARVYRVTDLEKALKEALKALSILERTDEDSLKNEARKLEEDIAKQIESRRSDSVTG